MPRQLTTADRVMLLMSLVPYLLEHGPTTVDELASVFEVDARVLRGLVRFLGTAGVPGETLTYQHEDLFDIDWDALEQHDTVSLINVVAVDDTPRFSSAETAAIVAGLRALAPMLPQDLRAHAQSASEKLASVEAVETRPAAVSVTADPAHAALPAIAEAIEHGLRLGFEYRDAEGRVTARIVDPLLLTQSGGGWYLRAHCHDRGGQRTFLVDRMRSARVLDAAADTRADRTAADPRIRVEGAAVTASVRLLPEAVQRVADFAPRVLSECEDGWLRAEVDLLHPAVAVRLVQAAPGLVVVERPREAREAVEAWADRALAAYEL